MEPTARTAEETVETFFEHVTAGDVDGAVALMDPDAAWNPAKVPWSRGGYRGPDGVREYLAAWAAELEDCSANIERVLGCGDEAVALGTGSGRVRATGRSFSVPFAFVFAVRDGLVVRMDAHIDTATIRDAFESTAAR